ncbi:MAG: phosphate signaling complex protein PhoU [Treponema sp.]|nr:phosphate signaling complex protein PhoU [Treponema sp.]MCL2243577.1 phosphate signaling complex protein PhoU [Treponema sp.]
MVTRNFFSEELSRLRQDILAMAAKVEENLAKALTALRACDAELAKEVRASDADVDALQTKIEDHAAIILATQQPVARDLREMVTIFKLTSSIERIGDYAVHLAKAAKKLTKAGVSPFRAQEHLEKMAETGQIMLRTAISAYLEQNAEKAREAAAMDSIINSEYKIITGDILKLMKKKSSLVKSAHNILQSSNQIERLGDHITNICEAVIYMVEGRHEELNE